MNATATHRRLIKTIKDLGFKQAFETKPEYLSLFFSQIAYFKPSTASKLTKDLSHRNFHYIDEDGAQAYVIEFTDVTYVTFRGTEFSELKDIQTSINFIPKTIHVNGEKYKVHRGFYNSYKKLHNKLFNILLNIKTPIIFTGHSLGGALAQISGLYFGYSTVHTFGAPRVFVNRCQNPTTHVIHFQTTNDIVTTVPWSLPGLDYKHSGEFVHLYSNKYKVIENHFLITYIEAVMNQRNDGQNRTFKERI